jgi:hypothetical protein
VNGGEGPSEHLAGGSRVVVIAQKDVDLRPQAPDNKMFLLKMAEGSLASGGRGGGFGERRVVKVLLYQLKGGSWSKDFETEDEVKVSQFEIPYYVSRLPFLLADGTESIGYGVVEPELVQQLLAKTGTTATP